MISREDIIRMATTKEQKEYWDIDDESNDRQKELGRTEDIRQEPKHASSILLDAFLSLLQRR